MPLLLDFGSSLLVSVDNSTTAANLRTVLTPTQGAETAAVSSGVGANRVGSFSLHLSYTLGGAERQCALLSSLIVGCKNGQQEVGGQCVQSLCDRAAVSFEVGDDPERGARSVIQATLTLPPGATASVAATPQNSTIPLPLASGNGTDSAENVWTGSVALPKTGEWSVAVMIGREQCAVHSTSLSLGCLETFVDDRQGRCVCPAGHENVRGRCQPVIVVDPCSVATLLGAPRQNGNHPVSVKPRTALAVVLNRTGNLVNFSFQTLLVPTQGTEMNDVTENVWLNQTGSFSLSLQYSLESSEDAPKQCSLVSALVVECGIDEQEIDGECIPRTSCLEENGFWFDSAARQCRIRPLMTVRSASPQLSIVAPKVRSGAVAAAQAEVRLARGDVDADKQSRVLWNARTSAAWLRVLTPSGEVYSDAPVAHLDVAVDSNGLNDTRCTGSLRAAISVVSSLDDRTDLFENGSSSVVLDVEVAIEAALFITVDDVVISTSDTSALNAGDTIISGETLLASVTAFDFERLAIPCTGLLIRLRLAEKSTGQVRSLELQYRDGNTYNSEVPSSWIEATGAYTLAIEDAASDVIGNATSGSIVLQFSVQAGNFQMYVGAAIASALALIAALVGYLIYRKRGSYQRMKAAAVKLLGAFWTVCLLFLDAWDILGDTLVYLNVRSYQHKAWVNRIFLPFSLFFASSCLVSLVGLTLKLKGIAEFVHSYFWPKEMDEQDGLLKAKRHAQLKLTCSLLVALGMYPSGVSA
jgi:hypothetical protein